jgi:hypothetical protein
VRKAVTALLVIVMILALTSLAFAQLSGSQTITWEYKEQIETTYTSVLDYAVTENLHFTLMLNRFPTEVVELDLSTTYYLFRGGWFYTTLGVSRDWKTEGVHPYLSITIGF